MSTYNVCDLVSWIGNLFIQSATKCTCANFILLKSETFLYQSLGNHWNTFPNNREKIVDSNAKLRKRSGLSFCSSFNDNWECFLFWNENFYLQIKKYKEKLTVVYITENDSTVCYFNKARYLFGMNNQLALPRTERLFYFKITSS